MNYETSDNSSFKPQSDTAGKKNLQFPSTT